MPTWLAALLIGIVAVDTPPVRPLSQWVHTTWSTRDGAPTEPRALAQTADGYLWIGTRWGLVRFDGVRFVPQAFPDSQAVPKGGVGRLLATRDGSLWIVWRGGAVSRLNRGGLTTYSAADGLPVVYDLAEDGDGALIAGSASGLVRFFEGAWEQVSREWGFPGTESQAVWFDRDGTLWAQTEDRVVYRPAGSRTFLDAGMPLTRAPGPARFAQTRDGTVWMAEFTRSAHTLPRVGDTDPITEVLVGAWALQIDREGSVWIGSLGDGLRLVRDPDRIRGRRIARFGVEAEHFTAKDGLLSDVVLALLEDREGGMWVATTGGLERFREGAFTPETTPGEVRPRVVYATRDTSVWTSAFGVLGFFRIHPRRREMVDSAGTIYHTLFEDASGQLWSVVGPYIVRFQGGRFQALPLRPSPAENLGDIVIDRAGTIWVFDHLMGLLRVDHDSLVPAVPLPPSIHTAGYLLADRRGRIWLGQYDRVVRYDRGTVTVFAAAEHEELREVNGVLEDPLGRIWVFGEAGLSWFDGERFLTVDRHRVLGRSVYGVAIDDDGAWWLAMRDGVLRLPPGEIDRAIADSTHRVRFHRFYAQDGLSGEISATLRGPLVTRSADGRIWVATNRGVASTDPRTLVDDPAPSVLIEVLRLGGRELVPSADMVLPPNVRDLEIDYTATSLSTPDRVQFRYRLDGEDPAWHEVGTRRRAYYTRLGPGDYRFRVAASNGDEVWNEAGGVLAFRVLPAWYQTLWFQGGVVLLIGGLGAAASVLAQRERHRRAHAALKANYEVTLAERTRIAQDLHDTLLQGFAGVTLQLKAAELALPDQPDVAAETIFRVRRLARESLREARERVWDLREDVLRGADLPAALEALARERSAGSGIEVALNTSGTRRRLARSLEDIAFRIGREAVANVVGHAGASRIEISVEFGAARLRLEIRDDGRGFSSEEGEAARRSGHLGVSGMRDRAASAGGRCEVSARPGGGTVVTLELPLARSTSR